MDDGPDLVEPVVHTSRLDLHHIGAAELIHLFESPHDPDPMSSRPFTNPYGELVDDTGPLRARVPRVRRDASVNTWFVRWIVWRDTAEVAGSTSFHGPPDADGVLEIGLGVVPPFRNRGIATEAVMGMWGWAVDRPGVEVLRYTVAVDNVASQRVIEKLGFERSTRRLDATGAEEDVYDMPAATFRRGR